jgi:ClpP class serine protease
MLIILKCKEKNMSYNERKEMYVKLEKLRNRKLIVYVTSIRPNLSSSMAADAILPLIDQIKNIPENCKEIDFLIISNGGDPITALRMMSILRERFDKITVLIPYVAYSAATILALGADEIIMHPFSNLGPVDPQLTINKKNEIGQNENLHFSSEDLRNYINFVKNDIKIKKPKELVNALESITKEVGVLNIGGAKRSQQLSLELSKKLLKTHMKDKQKVKKIAKSMNLSYYHHGYAVSRKEAHDLGLNIINPEKELEELLWNIWENFKLEMKCDYAFNIIDKYKNILK